jgi:DNA-binding transcriptional regulator of glucitol operon
VRRLLTPRWVFVHVGVLVLVTGFLALGWWQITRAAAGNVLSYGYSFEWPVFAGFVAWVWITEMRKTLRGSAPDAAQPTDARTVGQDGPGEQPAHVPQAQAVRAQTERPRRRRNEAAYDDSDDPELAAYNHYLAWRAAHPHATTADYPGYSTQLVPRRVEPEPDGPLRKLRGTS